MVNIPIHDFKTLIEAGKSYLSSQKYSPITASSYIRIWQQAMDYVTRLNVTLITDEILDRFVNDTYSISKYLHPKNSKERGISRPLIALMDFKKTGNFSRYYNYQPDHPISSAFQEVMEIYREWLIDKGQRVSSIATKLFRLKVFFRTIESYGIKEPNDISYEVFIRFMDSMKNNVELPSFFTEEESSRILSSINRNTSQGKKDYLMLILALQYGIRISDILSLKISHINWDTMEIAFYQKKIDKYISLPVTETIKWAILDYLMNSRCKDTPYDYLFLKSKAPHTPYAGSSMHAMITKYVKLANIDITGRHHGMHALRHGAASRMLNNGVPLNIVSETLGHSSMNITEKYLKISIEQLRLAGLEVSYYVQ